MSEKTEVNKKWKEDMKSLMGEMLDQKLKELKPKIPISPPSSEHKHEKPEKEHPEHTLTDLLECPDCAPKVTKAVLEKEILPRKDYEYECVDCGTRVREEEEECPTCGGKEARSRG